MTKKEEWRPISGFERYEVSSLGRVRSKAYGRVTIRKLCKQLKAGYFYISLSENGRRGRYNVHKLVAEAFLVKVEGKEINHINRVKTDNRLENLEYVTRRENITHRHNSKTPGATYHAHSNLWKAMLYLGKKRIYLGYYKTPEEASQRYQAELKARGIENKYIPSAQKEDK